MIGQIDKKYLLKVFFLSTTSYHFDSLIVIDQYDSRISLEFRKQLFPDM